MFALLLAVALVQVMSERISLLSCVYVLFVVLALVVCCVDGLLLSIECALRVDVGCHGPVHRFVRGRCRSNEPGRLLQHDDLDDAERQRQCVLLQPALG